MQMTGRIARQLQNAGAAHAPVGDEQRSAGAQLRTRYHGLRMGYHQARQASQALVADAQREERRHRLGQLLPQPAQSFGPGLSARGDADIVIGRQLVQMLHLAACLHDDAQSAGLTLEKADDGMSILRAGKHAMVFLNHQCDAALFEPLERRTMVEQLEQPSHEPVTTRIDLAQIAHVLKRIGHITASSARYFNFSQHTVATFDDGHLQLGAHFLQVDGQKEAGRPSANYCYSSIHKLPPFSTTPSAPIRAWPDRKRAPAKARDFPSSPIAAATGQRRSTQPRSTTATCPGSW